MVLRIDRDRCSACGDCEALLPRIMSRIAIETFPLNPNNPQVNMADIHKAVEICPLSVLTLEDA